jgi:copper homeostasis protein
MNPNRIILEVATFTPNAAIAAAKGGADRIELCSGYSEGGLSPSPGTIQYVRKMVNVPIHVMIRPRIGDFIYNQTEKECILNDIAFCKLNGVNGIVVGALTEDGSVDTDFMVTIVREAFPMSVTFHRAFDLCPDRINALESLIKCGVHRILTSGGMPNITLGMDNLVKIVAQAKGRINILPGGGVNAENVVDLVKATGVTEVHFSGKVLVKTVNRANPTVNLTSVGEVSDTSWYECNADKVKDLIKCLNSSKIERAL